MLNDKSCDFLLSLARQTLVDYFEVGKKLQISDINLPAAELSREAATFVTLNKNGELRGCVGSLIPKKKMYEDVINNALMAGYADPRFSPLAQDELKEIKIEISVLSDAKPYIYKSTDELLGQIKVGEHGLILQQDYFQSTFLPQVWEDLPKAEEFLAALSQKAGLSADAWKQPGAEIFYYTVENFSE